MFEKVVDKMNEISPILEWMDESLKNEINHIKDSVLHLVSNKEAIEKLFSWESLTNEDCNFAKETVRLLIDILANQQEFSNRTIRSLEWEQKKLWELKKDFIELKKDTYKDLLTWLFNEIKFKEIFDELLKEYISKKINLFSITSLEIDNLLEMRDSYWEELFDDLIKIFAYFLWKKLWKVWMVFHFHWNEFLILSKLNSIKLRELLLIFLNDIWKLKSLNDIWKIFWHEREWFEVKDLETLETSLSLLTSVYNVKLSFSWSVLEYKDWLTKEEFLENVRKSSYEAKNRWKWIIL